jgi:ABC-type polysaccharide transport system permease subunit
MRNLKTESQSSLPIRLKGKRRDWSLFIISLPLMVIILLFSYVPLAGWIISFFEYRPGLSLLSSNFVGLKYIKMIFTDRNMTKVLTNTLIFSALYFAIYWMPVAFAILLNEIQRTRFRKLVQTVSTFPHFISWIIVYSLSFAMFSTDGVLNLFIKLFGGAENATNLLADADKVFTIQTAIAQWKGLGWSSIIYISAISGIDQELYESAVIDGAGHFRCAWNITLPGVLPTFAVMLVINIAGVFNTGYEQYFLFKNPVTAPKIEVLDLYVYRMGLQLGDFSYATAVGLVKSTISLILLFIANNISAKIRGKSVV